jgi:bis(5'-nucleosyl)-tetraphosphatase (symmetrical)
MAVYAIGDLQGCLDPLRRLLDRVAYDPSADRVWFTGDLVNRGPSSLASLRFVRSLGAAATVVLGNHDLHLLATAFTRTRPRKRRDTLQEILDAPDRGELLEWLRRRPLLHHDPQLGFAMVHAGLPPQWDLNDARAAAAEVESVLRGNGCEGFLRQMYGNSPALWNPALEGIDRLRYIVNAFTRMRFVRADGGLEFTHKGPAESAGPGLVPWFRFPGRRSTGLKIAFGHWSLLGGIECNDAYSLDTGCVYGGLLTALRLDDLARASVACGPELSAPGAD